MDMENVDFILCFTVFFAFPWKCSISESINVGADKLGVCPRRKMINLHLPWMAKNAFNIFPIGIAVSYIFQFLLISTTCHNPLENHGRNEHHIFFIFAFPNLFLAWRWKMLFLHCVLQCFMFFSEMVWSIELPFSSRKNLTFVRAETGKFYISLGWLKMCGTC